MGGVQRARPVEVLGHVHEQSSSQWEGPVQCLHRFQIHLAGVDAQVHELVAAVLGQQHGDVFRWIRDCLRSGRCRHRDFVLQGEAGGRGL